MICPGFIPWKTKIFFMRFMRTCFTGCRMRRRKKNGRRKPDGWKKKNWKTQGGTPVKNADLWKKLDEAASRHKVEWIWVKGHDGIEGNEMADQLANQGVEEVLKRNR